MTNKFEYALVEYAFKLDAIRLNSYGSTGWELITIIIEEHKQTLEPPTYTYYFKRKNEQPC